MDTIFTIDLEDWNDALHVPANQHSSFDSFFWILKCLKEHNIKAIIYKLDYIPYRSNIHEIKTHGTFHRKWENADRRPYQRMGFTGGFWFRILPLWFIKNQIKKHGMFYCHPHDFDEQHPRLNNFLINWKRHVGLGESREKLKKLLREIEFRKTNSR